MRIVDSLNGPPPLLRELERLRQRHKLNLGSGREGLRDVAAIECSTEAQVSQPWVLTNACSHVCQLSVRIAARVFTVSHGRNIVARLRRRRSTSRPSHESRPKTAAGVLPPPPPSPLRHAGPDRRSPVVWSIPARVRPAALVRSDPALRKNRPERYYRLLVDVEAVQRLGHLLARFL
jgi:hypothetical protein